MIMFFWECVTGIEFVIFDRSIGDMLVLLITLH